MGPALTDKAFASWNMAMLNVSPYARAPSRFKRSSGLTVKFLRGYTLRLYALHSEKPVPPTSRLLTSWRASLAVCVPAVLHLLKSGAVESCKGSASLKRISGVVAEVYLDPRSSV